MPPGADQRQAAVPRSRRRSSHSGTRGRVLRRGVALRSTVHGARRAPAHRVAGDAPRTNCTAPLVERRSPGSRVAVLHRGTTPAGPKVWSSARRRCAAVLGYLSEGPERRAGRRMLHPGTAVRTAASCITCRILMHGGVNVVPALGSFDPAGSGRTGGRIGTSARSFAAPTMVRRLVDHVLTGGRKPEGLATPSPTAAARCTWGRHDAKGRSAGGDRPALRADLRGQGESPMTITVLPRDVINDHTHPRHRERLASVGHAA